MRGAGGDVPIGRLRKGTRAMTTDRDAAEPDPDFRLLTLVATERFTRRDSASSSGAGAAGCRRSTGL
jgi:hypothetical protein